MHVTKRSNSFSKLIITLPQEAFLDFSNSTPINFNILYVYCICFIHKKRKGFFGPTWGNIAPTENACSNTSFFKEEGTQRQTFELANISSCGSNSEAVFFSFFFFFCQDHQKIEEIVFCQSPSFINCALHPSPPQASDKCFPLTLEILRDSYLIYKSSR